MATLPLKSIRSGHGQRTPGRHARRPTAEHIRYPLDLDVSRQTGCLHELLQCRADGRASLGNFALDVLLDRHAHPHVLASIGLTPQRSAAYPSRIIREKGNKTCRKKIISSLLVGLACCGSAMSQAAYDPAKCAEVAGTLNIGWVEISPTPNGCVGIEFTNGTQHMAQSGRLQMVGTGTSTPCLLTDTYDLTLSPDGASLVGTIASLPTPVTFTRAPGVACFTGHWAAVNTDIVGYLSADFFTPAAPTKQVAVPTLQQWSLVLLAALLSGIAFWRQQRKS